MNLPEIDNKVRKLLALTNFNERKKYFLFKKIAGDKEAKKTRHEKKKKNSFKILEKTEKSIIYNPIKNLMKNKSLTKFYKKNCLKNLKKKNSVSMRGWKNVSKVLKKIKERKKKKENTKHETIFSDIEKTKEIRLINYTTKMVKGEIKGLEKTYRIKNNRTNRLNN